jgi:hypothetical protein
LRALSPRVTESLQAARTGSLGDGSALAVLIDDLEAALSAVAPGDRNEVSLRINVALCHGIRMQYLDGGPEDVDRVIALLRDVLSRRPQPDQAASLATLELAARVRRFRSLHQDEDLDGILSLCEQYWEQPGFADDTWSSLDCYAMALAHRYARDGELADLATLLQLVLPRLHLLVPRLEEPGAPDVLRHRLRVCASSALRSRFDRMGDPADLDLARGLLQRADIGAGAAAERYWDLQVWGCALVADVAAEPTSVAVIDECVAAIEEALALVDRQSVEWRATALHLAEHRVRRHEAGGAPSDLDAADELVAEVRRQGAADRRRAGNTAAVGAHSAHARFLVTQDAAVLDEAIRSSREALEPDASPGPDLASRLLLLSRALLDRYGLTAARADLDEAEELAHRVAPLVAESWRRHEDECDELVARVDAARAAQASSARNV